MMPLLVLRRTLHPFLTLLTLLSLSALAACDVAVPEPERIVVEAFVRAGEPLPTVTVRRTAALDEVDAAPAVPDATVELDVEGEPVVYEAVPGEPGAYRSLSQVTPRSGDALTFGVTWQGQRATAASRLPDPITLDSVRVVPSAMPVEAVFADSVGLGVSEGFIYPVTVTLFWTAPAADTAWVRVRLRPPAAFPSALVDFVLSTDETRREAEHAREDRGGAELVRRWSGTYAVPVESAGDPLPPHTLGLALVRGAADYARYVLSRSDPGQREPEGNVTGGFGIAVGVAVDEQSVAVGE